MDTEDRGIPPQKDIGVWKKHGASLSTGALEFLPVPFLDEWLIKRQRRGMVADILEKRSIRFDADVPNLLVGGGRAFLVRLGSMTRGLFMKPLKKLFRTVLFWFTARSAARTAMVTYFLARFLHHPGLVEDGDYLTEERARDLSEVFADVSKNIDLQALKGGLRQLTKMFGQSKEVRGEEVSAAIEHEAPGFIGNFDEKVSQGLALLKQGRRG